MINSSHTNPLELKQVVFINNNQKVIFEEFGKKKIQRSEKFVRKKTKKVNISVMCNASFYYKVVDAFQS